MGAALPSLGSIAGFSSPTPQTGPAEPPGQDAGTQDKADQHVSPASLGKQRQAFQLLDVARRLVPEDARLQNCHRVRVSAGSPVRAFLTDAGYVSFQNVQTCGRVSCPVCGPRIRARRGKETVQIAQAAQGAGLDVYRLDWTHGHGPDEALPDMLEVQRQAFRGMSSGKAALSQQLARMGEFGGQRRALDYTYGLSGHHPHAHSMVLLGGADVHDVTQLVQRAWQGAAGKVGLPVGHAGVKVAMIDPAGAGYLYKPGYLDAPEGSVSRTPWQLLQDAAQGDDQAGARWREYALAMSGQRMTTTSPGLRRLLLRGTLQADGDDVALSRPPVPTTTAPLLEFTRWQGVTAEVLDYVAADQPARDGLK